MEKAEASDFVCFGTRAEAEAAQKKMDGRWVFGRRLYVSFAQAKAERAAELRRKYQDQAPRQERRTSSVRWGNAIGGWDREP